MADVATISGGQTVLNFSGAQSGYPSAGVQSFKTLFSTTTPTIYNGSGTIAPAASPSASLIILANSASTVPGGYSAVLDSATGDTLTGGGNGTTFFLQNSEAAIGTVLNLTAGASTIWALGSDTIYAGNNDATVMTAAANVTVVGGAGSLYFVGGAGAISVSGASGGTTLFGGTGSANTYLAGGNGTNALVGGTGNGNTTLVGGSGSTVEWAKGSGATTLIAGTGQSTLIGVTGTGNELLKTSPTGSAGITTMDLNNATDSVFGGAGISIVYGGLGKDIYGFVKGQAGGAELIFNFKKTDVIVFGGYAGNPIASEKVIHGSDVITLVDGTKITVEGYHHTIFK
jgi:Ca2+-binding RTX toxin-like protein